MKFYQTLQTIFMKMDSLWVQIDNLTAYKTVIIITVTMPFQQSFSVLLNVLHQAVHSDWNIINYILWLMRAIITSSTELTLYSYVPFF